MRILRYTQNDRMKRSVDFYCVQNDRKNRSDNVILREEAADRRPNESVREQRIRILRYAQNDGAKDNGFFVTLRMTE